MRNLSDLITIKQTRHGDLVTILNQLDKTEM